MKIAKAERVAEEAEAMDEGDSNICKYQHSYCVYEEESAADVCGRCLESQAQGYDCK